MPKGLDTPAGEAGKLMSGGEKQRFSLLLSLLSNKKILLLDEVTANLDSNTERIVRDNLKKLIVNEGYTIISVSHRNEFLKYASIIYEIKNGYLISDNRIINN
ncbi:MAG TPA: ATP-binding cassette domain-containing protein [Bacilli bacterium]|nr:MAG: Heterocyst differentiation ATP-binding protein HepA [Tenericutes bacterium ADurb.BinA124]HNZ49965.1 ATP-binding cassette domain-containing protein [Bacilli bacterium]HOH18159.1 ATP-binding cassette domain-containing protein [Bacilli bacterium]HPX84287.1 ATP-binding cassette domain-containing protein [Bacilli bacterium]HQC73998.1 ATP-binding cassette domain-containing protein [Bacilli bacterium]